jgi:hypothetical protein
MKKCITLIRFVAVFLCSNVAFGQSIQKDKLRLEIRQFDSQYTVNYGPDAVKPSFILGIHNTGPLEVELDQDIFFGHAGDEDQNDITF